jgi:hypothetical protein
MPIIIEEHYAPKARPTSISVNSFAKTSCSLCEVDACFTLVSISATPAMNNGTIDVNSPKKTTLQLKNSLHLDLAVNINNSRCHSLPKPDNTETAERCEISTKPERIQSTRVSETPTSNNVEHEVIDDVRYSNRAAYII